MHTPQSDKVDLLQKYRVAMVTYFLLLLHVYSTGLFLVTTEIRFIICSYVRTVDWEIFAQLFFA